MMSRLLILAATVTLAGVVTQGVARTEWLPPSVPLGEFPAEVGHWTARSATPLEPDVLAVLGVDDYLNRLYATSDGGIVGLYVGYYRSQRQGDTIHSPLNCLPGAGWQIVGRERKRIRIAPPPSDGVAATDESDTIEVNRLVVVKGIERRVVVYWYQDRDGVVASEYRQRLHTVLDAIRSGRTDAAFVRIIAPVRGEGDSSELAATQTASQFAVAAYPRLSQFLQ